MHEYAEFLVPFASKEENNSGIKSQLTIIYNAFLQTKTDRQHLMETKKHAKQVIAIIGSLLFILLMIIILNVQNKRHKRKLETQIETERQAHTIQQKALLGKLKKEIKPYKMLCNN